MSLALRLTDKTKFKIAKHTNLPLADIQAIMEYYSIITPEVTLRPYAVIDLPVSEENRRYCDVVPDDLFHRHYRFVDEEDPNMFAHIDLLR